MKVIWKGGLKMMIFDHFVLLFEWDLVETFAGYRSGSIVQTHSFDSHFLPF